MKWHDACFKEKGWYAAERIRTDVRMETESAGFLVKEDRHGIVLAVDRDSEDGKWRGLTYIPHAMIKKKKVFKLE